MMTIAQEDTLVDIEINGLDSRFNVGALARFELIDHDIVKKKACDYLYQYDGLWQKIESKAISIIEKDYRRIESTSIYSKSYEDILSSAMNILDVPIDPFSNSGPCIKFFHDDKCIYLLVIQSHLFVDGLSANFLLEDVCDYIDTGILKQREYRSLTSQKSKDLTMFWEKKFSSWQNSNELFMGEVPKSRNRSLNICFSVSDSVSNEINSFVSKGFSPLHIYSLALARTLKKYKSSNQVSFRTIIHGRNMLNKSTYGFYSQLLPISFSLDEFQGKILSDLKSVKRTIFDYYKNSKISEVERSKLARRQSVDFTSDVVLNYLQMSPPVNLKCGGKCSYQYLPPTTTKYPLEIVVEDYKVEGSDINVRIDYDETISKEMIEIFYSLINSEVENILGVETSTSLKFDELLTANNASEKDIPYERIDKWLEDSFVIHANQVAYLGNDSTLTYSQLDHKSKKLTQTITKSIGCGNTVAIKLKRGEELLVAIVSILRSKNAFLPLPLDASDDYCKKLINEAGAIVFDDAITTKKTCSKHPPVDQNLAYVLFTSGSTGKPKGVCISHQSLCNRIFWQIECFNNKKGDRFLWKTPYTFDVSVWEFFLPLLSGGILVGTNQGEEKDPRALLSYIEKKQINYIHFIPTFLYELCSFKKTDVSTLKAIIVSGEALTNSIVAKFDNYFNGPQLYNLYGPTEATIDVTFHHVTDGGNIPIGKPVYNTKMYVLDANKNACTPYIKGEIFIGGEQLAIKYLDDFQTEESFITHEKYGRLYRTGDYGYFDHCYNLFYGGRVDQQMKVRGQRVDLTCIEETVETIAEVTQAVVIYSNSKLTCFVVGVPDEKIASLRSQVENIMPWFMIPDLFLTLEKFPRGRSGKIDRKKLISFIPMTENLDHHVSSLSPTFLKIMTDVLEVESINPNISFIANGGDSIQAIRIVALMEKSGTIVLTKDLLSGKSLVSLPLELASETKSEILVNSDSYDNFCLPMNQLQQGMWIESLRDNEQYIERYTFEFTRDVSTQEFTFAVENLLLNNPILKSAVSINDKGEYSIADKSFKLDQFLDENATDFSQADVPLLSIVPSMNKGVVSGFTWKHHHLLLDGWSVGKVIFAFLELLSGNTVSKNSNFDAINNFQKFEDQNKVSADVIDYFGDYQKADLLTLPMSSSGAGVEELSLDSVDMYELKLTAKHYGVTPSVLLMYAWGMVLSISSDNRKIYFGSISSGRDFDIHGIEDALGLFVQTRPILIDNNLEKIKEVLEALTENLLKYSEFGPIGVSSFRERIGNQLDLNHLFIIENYPLINKLESHSLIKNPKIFEKSNLPFIFQLFMMENLFVKIEYNKQMFSRAQVQYLTDAFVDSVNSLIQYKFDKTVDLYNQVRSKLINEEFVVGEKPTYLNSTTAQIMFYDASIKFKANAAIKSKDESWTYKQLDKRIQSIAQVLLDNNVQRGDNVALHLERGCDLVASVLAILWVGGCYVPIATNLPLIRAQEVLDLSESKVLISSSKAILGDKLKSEKLVKLDDVREIGKTLSPYRGDMEDSLYLIFTSGSTGTPKGVIQNHRSVCNMIQWKIHHSRINHCCNVLFFTSIGFDVSFEEIMTALVSGGTLYVLDDSERDNANEVLNIIQKEEINLISMPNSYLQMLLSVDSSIQQLGTVKYVIHGGEQLTLKGKMSEWLNDSPDFVIHNNYGPTETHMVTANIFVRDEAKTYRRPTIGRPMTYNDIWIVGKDQEIAPPFSLGELYLGGMQVGTGYWNNIEETDAKFQTRKDGSKWYKTSDIAFWDAEGRIHFVGRNDNQIKIRANRVELGEVEEKIKEIGVDDVAVVVQKENDENILAAFYVSNTICETMVLERLELLVPSYMIPSYIVRLEIFPRTFNGKIDRVKLSKTKINKEIFVVHPETDLEKEIYKIWSDNLNDTEFGIDQKLSHIGAHSLIQLKILAQLNIKLSLNLRLEELTYNQTIRTLANHILLLRKNGPNECSEGMIRAEGPFALTVGQINMLSIHRSSSRTGICNVGAFYKVDSTFTPQKFNLMIEELLETYDGLNLVLDENDEMVFKKFEFPQINKIAIDSKSMSAEFQGFLDYAFDLQEGPLYRFTYFEIDDVSYIGLNFHHLVVDGWSLGVMINYLAQDVSHTPLRRFSDFIYEQSKLKIGYEQEKLIRIDALKQKSPVFRMKHCRYQFDSECFNSLDRRAKSLETSRFSLFVTSAQASIAKAFSQNSFDVLVMNAGRENALDQYSVGCFISFNMHRFNSNNSLDVNAKKIDKQIKRLGANRESPYREIYPDDWNESEILWDISIGQDHSDEFEKRIVIDGHEWVQIDDIADSKKYNIYIHLVHGNNNQCIDFYYNEAIITKEQIDTIAATSFDHCRAIDDNS